MNYVSLKSYRFACVTDSVSLTAFLPVDSPVLDALLVGSSPSDVAGELISSLLPFIFDPELSNFIHNSFDSIYVENSIIRRIEAPCRSWYMVHFGLD
jgi:hypothetical protein